MIVILSLGCVVILSFLACLSSILEQLDEQNN